MKILEKLIDRIKSDPPHTKVTPISSIISINGGSSPFENLLPVSNYIGTKTFAKLDDDKAEQELSRFIANDKYPLPATSDREGYHGTRHFDYWLSGLQDYSCIKQALNKHGATLRDDLPRVLDLGCSSGRVLRHFLCQENNLDLWGADINMRHVEWARRFLGTSLKIFQNTLLPHLPLEDNSFSVVYAFSVFTHIDEFELAWLAEIRRILKKDGFAYLTIHSDNTWKNIEKAPPLYNNLIAMKDHIHEHVVTPELFKAGMPAERVVLKWQTVSTYNSNVFHSINYINNVWGRFFEVVDIICEGHNYQDVIMLRKRI